MNNIQNITNEDSDTKMENINDETKRDEDR